MGFRLAQAIKRVLASDSVRACWSRRAQDQINSLRKDYPCDRDSTVLLSGAAGQSTWWTFGGVRANAAITNELGQLLGTTVEHDSLSLMFANSRPAELQIAITELRARALETLRPGVDEKAIDGLKFSECLPVALAQQMLEARLQDQDALRESLIARLRIVVTVD
ncbi:hypothetical protein [Anatilimnocola floriformis]|uniref:hypothetical protein n=1 Tax=Anatilimnocola floriformis TaxID=2948575 RepID=UPI0020C2D882|nr:hypothetical protein [Anatilimnocola floriformis]